MTTVYPDLVKVAGGAVVVARLAAERIANVQANEALHFCEIVLTADGHHRVALESKLKVLEVLRDRCRNSIECGWLEHFIHETKQKLEGKK